MTISTDFFAWGVPTFSVAVNHSAFGMCKRASHAAGIRAECARGPARHHWRGRNSTCQATPHQGAQLSHAGWGLSAGTARLCSASVDVMNTLSRWGGDSGGGAYSKSNGAAGVSALRVLGAYIDVVTGAPKVSIAHPNGIAAALHQAQTCRMEAERTAAQLEASKAFHASQLELLRADMTAYQSQCAAQLSAMHAQAAALKARHAEQLDAKDAQVAALEARHAKQLGEMCAAMQAAEVRHFEALKNRSKEREKCAALLLLRPLAHRG